MRLMRILCTKSQNKKNRKLYQTKQLNDIGFGVELEYISTKKNLQYPFLAIDLNRFFKEKKLTKLNWKLARDETIVDSDHRTGFEVVSPVLRGEEGLKSVKQILNALCEYGITINRTTGLHVHVDVQGFDLAQLKMIAISFLKYERVFDAFVTSDRLTNGTCLSNLNVFQNLEDGINIIARCETTAELIDCFSPNRTYKLNLRPIKSPVFKPNIEFREHQGTMKEEEIVNWILLLVRFVNHAATKDMSGMQIRQCTLEEEIKEFFVEMIKEADLESYYLQRLTYHTAPLVKELLAQ